MEIHGKCHFFPKIESWDDNKNANLHRIDHGNDVSGQKDDTSPFEFNSGDLLDTPQPRLNFGCFPFWPDFQGKINAKSIENQ